MTTSVTTETVVANFATVTSTYSSFHEVSIIEGTTTYLSTIAIPVTQMLVLGTVMGTESASVSSSTIDTSQAAESNDTPFDESQNESVGSEDSLSVYPRGGTESYPSVNISHAIVASSSSSSSSSAFPRSTNEAARSGSSTVINSWSSTSAGLTAAYTGAASKVNVLSAVSLYLIVFAGHIVL
ncbi:uncharacterized protein N7484_005452 [Penicillium longicatenatum]|uniref:uncharacterized protein n=1 Tax=Penicillium longicatenatum TaxID=1561947 RepID=UPI002546EEB0|nr:uncharacterized protein N7484_005452 [Penicillium longicatenatum]KAJ5642945.1 hypothetical protein N7484_005452 [Penicillium longicatenatum]